MRNNTGTETWVRNISRLPRVVSIVSSAEKSPDFQWLYVYRILFFGPRAAKKFRHVPATIGWLMEGGALSDSSLVPGPQRGTPLTFPYSELLKMKINHTILSSALAVGFTLTAVSAFGQAEAEEAPAEPAEVPVEEAEAPEPEPAQEPVPEPEPEPEVAPEPVEEPPAAPEPEEEAEAAGLGGTPSLFVFADAWAG